MYALKKGVLGIKYVAARENGEGSFKRAGNLAKLQKQRSEYPGKWAEI